MKDRLTFCFDVDGTLCSIEKDYTKVLPREDVITTLNELYDEGHMIKIFTARGAVSGNDYTDLTQKQLESWGVKYHELIMGKKPHFDFIIDDKAIHVDEWLKSRKLR
jgi:hypothetical protein